MKNKDNNEKKNMNMNMHMNMHMIYFWLTKKNHYFFVLTRVDWIVGPYYLIFVIDLIK